jgi:hypothetical protein
MKAGADFIALSFVRNAADIQDVHAIMDEIGFRIPVIAKIEKPQAVDNLEEIVAAFDGIMVARGDLGVEMPIEEVPLVQKHCIELAREAAKPVIVATQMLDSMITNSSPTRAEATDCANAVLDGADALMLSGETSVGAFPIETFREIIDKELAGTSSINCTDYSQDLQRYCSDPQNIAFIPNPVQVKVGAAPILGPKTAPVIIVEYSDFECPFCARAYQTVNEIKKEYGDKVAIAYKQLPLSFHKNAEPAARASVCAQEQGKFWEYHDKLFDVQKQ